MLHEDVMTDVRGFMKSRVILTAAELDLFSHLHDKPTSVNELVATLGLDLRATTRVLDCLVTFGLLKKEGARYQDTEKGAFLSSRHPETVLPMVLHVGHLWVSWSELTDIVRQGTGRELKPGLKFTEKEWQAFIGAMHVGARRLSLEIADAYDLSPYRCLLDVGGASGTYTIAFLKKNPLMRAVIFELEDVMPMARERLNAEGLADRVELVTGDFYEDEFPKGCDLALLSAIIHQNSPEENLGLYLKTYRALEPGGVLLIRDHVMDESRLRPPAGALFAINMLVNTHGGDTYTFREIQGALEKAGFVDVRLIKAGEQMDCMVEARKPPVSNA